jgi:hypothetical protein
MILPTKHVPTQQSYLGIGALVLERLDRDCTISELWDRLRTEPQVGTFQRLVLALDFLYAIGAVQMKSGLLRRAAR